MDMLLTWAKRIEAQRVQMAVIGSLHENKNFDTIMCKDGEHRETRPTTVTTSTRRICKYCGQAHKLR